jgi:hypothetical protein
VPRRNYGFEKRQKELAKQQKRQAKAQRRKDRAEGADSPGPDESPEAPTPTERDPE